ncbi:MAG: hypothetical protein JST48_10925 [Bacteroidetes bacterium]|nr:hypothetical protein [Bacteroidota bacterium]
MKKVSVLLSAMAFVFAVGGALASQKLLTNIQGYEFIDRPGTDDDECIARINCDTDGTVDCKVTTASPILHDSSNPATSCGLTLKMKTP